jgi:hypothetical protein
MCLLVVLGLVPATSCFPPQISSSLLPCPILISRLTPVPSMPQPKLCPFHCAPAHFSLIMGFHCPLCSSNLECPYPNPALCPSLAGMPNKLPSPTVYSNLALCLSMHFNLCYPQPMHCLSRLLTKARLMFSLLLCLYMCVCWPRFLILLIIVIVFTTPAACCPALPLQFVRVGVSAPFAYFTALL